MDTWGGNRTVSRQRCLLQGGENLRPVRGLRESRKAGRERVESEGLEHRNHPRPCSSPDANMDPRSPGSYFPNGLAKEEW